MTTVIAIVGPIFGTLLVLWILSRQIVRNADESRLAEERGGRIEFTPNPRAIWCALIFIGLMVFLAADFVIAAPGNPMQIVMAVFCLVIVAMILSGFPSSIALTGDGMEQKFWLRPTKKIEWKQISRIESDPKRNRLTIVGGAAKIVHTRQLPDRTRLIVELQKHCPGKVPAEIAPKMVI
ncbi:MAG TPA: hypothetical protein VKR52_10240 [Terracidiphilus sp.]|nr:hypothetical protein [Terracidiphilus sp.]